MSLSRFYGRRTLRIFPAYYAFLLLSFTLDRLQGSRWSAALRLSAVTYTVNYFNAFRHHPANSISHAWSLGAEEQFYLLWPLAFVLLARRGRGVLAVAVGGAAIVAALSRSLLLVRGAEVSYLYNAFDTRFDNLAVGCLLALVADHRRGRLRAPGGMSCLAAARDLVLLLASRLLTTSAYHYSAGFSVNALLVAVLIVQLMQLYVSPLWSWLEHPAIRYVGGISYAIYLYHQWGDAVGRHLASGRPAVFTIGLVATFALATGSYYVIERLFSGCPDVSRRTDRRLIRCLVSMARRAARRPTCARARRRYSCRHDFEATHPLGVCALPPSVRVPFGLAIARRPTDVRRRAAHVTGSTPPSAVTDSAEGARAISSPALVESAARIDTGNAAGELDRSFARGLAWTGGVKWLVQIVSWVTTIAVARLLSPGDYGLLSMAAVFLAFISVISESGIGSTVVTIRGITGDQTAQINGAAVLLGVASFGVACVAAVPIGWFYDSPALPGLVMATSVTLVISAFRVVPGALLQREMRFDRVAVIDGVQALVQSATTVVLALLGFRYWSLVLASLAGAAVGTAATVMSRPYPMRRPQRATLAPLFGFSRHVLLTRLFWYMYANSDFIVAGKRLGSQALGAYSYAWTLASLPVDKITALVGAVTPSVFAAVQHDVAELRRYFLTVTEGLALLVFPLTVGLALVAPELVPVVFGAKWSSMIVPLQALAMYASVRAITPPASQTLFVTGDTRFLMYQNGITAVALPIAFVIGSRWGTLGIAVAWIIAHPILVYLPLNHRVLKRLDLSVPGYLRALWPALSGCLLMWAFVIAARALVPVGASSGARLTVETLAGAIGYWACLLALHRERARVFRSLWHGHTG